MIPPFDDDAGNLPIGIHEATWEEVVARYGYSAHRLTLLAGLKDGLDALRLAGCRRAYINGSFISAKEIPGDFDVCREVAGVQGTLVNPVLLDFSDRRSAQKATFGGEFFLAEAQADDVGTRFLEFFQTGKDAIPKGIIALDLGALP